jgi:hypothetical protein
VFVPFVNKLVNICNVFIFVNNYCAVGFFNETDTLEFCSMLIYLQLQMGLYSQRGQQDAVLIKW